MPSCRLGKRTACPGQGPGRARGLPHPSLPASLFSPLSSPTVSLSSLWNLASLLISLSLCMSLSLGCLPPSVEKAKSHLEVPLEENVNRRVLEEGSVEARTIEDAIAVLR